MIFSEILGLGYSVDRYIFLYYSEMNKMYNLKLKHF